MKEAVIVLRMDQYRYSYTMNNEASKKVFRKTCRTIEKNLKGLKKEKLLIDVDWSLLQIYYLDGEEIAVYNCNKISCVYVESNVDLGEILERESVYDKIPSNEIGTEPIEDKYKYGYIVHSKNSKRVFQKTCKTIEKKLEGLIKEELLIDPDGSMNQKYFSDGEIIIVHNCFRTYCVYVESDVDLGEILGKESYY